PVARTPHSDRRNLFSRMRTHPTPLADPELPPEPLIKSLCYRPLNRPRSEPAASGERRGCERRHWVQIPRNARISYDSEPIFAPIRAYVMGSTGADQQM